MLFQVKVQELQQRLGVLHRHWKAESANPAIRNGRPLFFPGISVFMHVELKAQSYLIGGKRTRHQTRRELLQQPVQDENQRLQVLDWVFQLQAFFKSHRGIDGNEHPGPFSASEPLQMKTSLPEPFDERYRWHQSPASASPIPPA